MALQALLPLLAAGGGLLSAYGSYKAGRDQEKMYNAQAEAEEAATRFNLKNYQKEASATISRSRALRAGSGFEIDTGTPLSVDDAMITEAIFQEARMQEEGAARAASLRASGRNAKRAGTMQAVSSLLSSAGSFGKSMNMGAK